MGKRSSDTNNRVIATNRKARHLYEIEETFTAGLELLGSEVKSLRAGSVNIGDGYVDYRSDELWLLNVHIKPWPYAGIEQHDPLRPRKLLMKRAEIERIRQRIHEKGFSGVPIRFFLKNGWIKLEFGLGKGKKLHDKRHDIKERDARREMDRH